MGIYEEIYLIFQQCYVAHFSKLPVVDKFTAYLPDVYARITGLAFVITIPSVVNIVALEYQDSSFAENP